MLQFYRDFRQFLNEFTHLIKDRFYFLIAFATKKQEIKKLKARFKTKNAGIITLEISLTNYKDARFSERFQKLQEYT